MQKIQKFSRDGRLLEDDDEIVRDGQSIRTRMPMMDGLPAPFGQALQDALPPANITMLADGSAKHVFADGSSVVISPDRSATYFDCAGYMSHGLTNDQYLFAAERAGGTEGRRAAFDGMVDTEVARREMIDRMGAASQNELESRRTASDGTAEGARAAMIADMNAWRTEPSSI